MKTCFKNSTTRSIISVKEDPYCPAEPLQHACELRGLGKRELGSSLLFSLGIDPGTNQSNCSGKSKLPPLSLHPYQRDRALG